jgi:hypothetical protein
MKVFFYGLFMDKDLLATKGIEPAEVHIGFVDGFDLRIGERATLVRQPGGRAWGVVMDIAEGQAVHLYSEKSVSDYLAETVIVEMPDGTKVDAACYILPEGKATGTNKDYAAALLDLAARLDFPDSYLDRIRKDAGDLSS